VTEADVTFLGRLMREMQAEMRTIRAENAVLQRAITNFATRDEIHDRLSHFETRIEARLDQTERSVEERLERIEGLLRSLRSI
jgi:serine kinase of HPr protein (carbohydrate metabolism regulator)